MIEITETEVFGWKAAIRGMRNPMNSWDKSDSKRCTEDDSECKNCGYGKENSLPCPLENQIVIGENDLKLMKQLSKAGNDHGKYLRMINVTCDITAPLYWWKEFDTYKIGTTANSCSTMHKIHAKEFTMGDFSHEHLVPDGIRLLEDTIEVLNDAREVYMNFDEMFKSGELIEDITDKKDVWWQMIQLLPSSYNQKRTIQLNYAVLKNIYNARKNHKLDEWHKFCEWCESLPYFKEMCIEI